MSQQQTQFHEIPAQKKENSIPYEKLIQTEEFADLIKRKKAFIIPTTIFFLIFYFTLPILAAYTKVLHTEVLEQLRVRGFLLAYSFYSFGSADLFTLKSQKIMIK